MFMASTNLVLLGAVLFSAVLLFQVVTLPVEFNASSRAKALIVEHGIVTMQERQPSLPLCTVTRRDFRRFHTDTYTTPFSPRFCPPRTRQVLRYFAGSDRTRAFFLRGPSGGRFSVRDGVMARG